MSTTIAEYDVARYNALPDVRTVVKSLTKSGASALLKGPIKDAIIRHGVADRFAIAALHAPFHLEGDGIDEPPAQALAPGEQPVSFGNVTVPLNISTLAPEAQAHIVPALWGFRDGVASPLAFAYTHEQAVAASLAHALEFVAEMQEIVSKNPGAEHLGVALLAHAPVGVTAQQGRNAVTLPAAIGTLAPGDERYDVLWVVEGDEVVARGVVSGGSLAGHFGGPPRECYGYAGGTSVCYGYGSGTY